MTDTSVLAELRDLKPLMVLEVCLRGLCRAAVVQSPQENPRIPAILRALDLFDQADYSGGLLILRSAPKGSESWYPALSNVVDYFPLIADDVNPASATELANSVLVALQKDAGHRATTYDVEVDEVHFHVAMHNELRAQLRDMVSLGSGAAKKRLGRSFESVRVFYHLMAQIIAAREGRHESDLTWKTLWSYWKIWHGGWR